MLKRFSSASMPYNSTLSKRGRCPHIFVIGSSGKRRDFEETISGGGPWSQFRPHAVRAPIFHLQKKNTHSQPRQRLSKQGQCNAMHTHTRKASHEHNSSSCPQNNQLRQCTPTGARWSCRKNSGGTRKSSLRPPASAQVACCP